MKFVYTMDSIQPADEEARLFVAQMSEGQELTLGEVLSTKRTKKQNKSMWKYCTMLGEALNDAGFDMLTFPYRQGMEIPWTKHSVMETFWRPIQEAMFGQESTTEISTVEVQKIYKAMDRTICDRTNGVRVEWPCRYSQMLQDVA